MCAFQASITYQTLFKFYKRLSGMTVRARHVAFCFLLELAKGVEGVGAGSPVDGWRVGCALQAEPRIGGKP